MRGRKSRLREMEEGENFLSKEKVMELLQDFHDFGESSIVVPVPNLSGNAYMQMFDLKVKYTGNMCTLKGKDWVIEFSWKDMYFVTSSQTAAYMMAYTVKNDKLLFKIYGR